MKWSAVFGQWFSEILGDVIATFDLHLIFMQCHQRAWRSPFNDIFQPLSPCVLRLSGFLIFPKYVEDVMIFPFMLRKINPIGEMVTLGLSQKGPFLYPCHWPVASLRRTLLSVKPFKNLLTSNSKGGNVSEFQHWMLLSCFLLIQQQAKLIWKSFALEIVLKCFGNYKQAS